MTLDEILATVQPVPASDLQAAAFQLECELDRLRRRVERLVEKGATERDVRHALNTLHRAQVARRV